MKRLFVGFLLALIVAPSFSCEAGDGSGATEKKNAKSSSSSQHRSVQRNRQPRVAQSRPDRAGFCRDWYCTRATGSPWWPNAPGD